MENEKKEEVNNILVPYLSVVFRVTLIRIDITNSVGLGHVYTKAIRPWLLRILEFSLDECKGPSL